MFKHKEKMRRAATKQQAAFSLMEMMVALAIAGILYSVALPGYQHTIVKSSRAAARGVLINVLSRQEQYFINNKRYAISLASLGLPAPYYIDRQAEPVEESNAAYRVELDIVSAAYSGVRASPLNRQASDTACMTFSISRIGVRAVTGALSSNPAECW